MKSAQKKINFLLVFHSFNSLDEAISHPSAASLGYYGVHKSIRSRMRQWIIIISEEEIWKMGRNEIQRISSFIAQSDLHSSGQSSTAHYPPLRNDNLDLNPSIMWNLLDSGAERDLINPRQVDLQLPGHWTSFIYESLRAAAGWRSSDRHTKTWTCNDKMYYFDSGKSTIPMQFVLGIWNGLAII